MRCPICNRTNGNRLPPRVSACSDAIVKLLQGHVFAPVPQGTAAYLWIDESNVISLRAGVRHHHLHLDNRDLESLGVPPGTFERTFAPGVHLECWGHLHEVTIKYGTFLEVFELSDLRLNGVRLLRAA